MPTMSRDNSETSVTFSLAELARIEEERVRVEDERRARTREMEARERREAQARRRAEEEAQVAAQAEARARRQREEAEEQARAKAREQAALEVARIQAQAKVQLDAENAQRAHELAVLRANNESGRRRLQVALAAVLGLVICGGSAAAFGVHREVASLGQENERLREGQSALSRERDQAKATELASLDRRLEALRARPFGRDDAKATAEVRQTVEAARKAIDAKALDHSRMRSFGEALDAFEARIGGLEKLQALERRHADLEVWAGQRKKADAGGAARNAALSARVLVDESSLRAYETALDRLRDSLSKEGAQGGGVSVVQPIGPTCTDPNDPLCGLNGRAL